MRSAARLIYDFAGAAPGQLIYLAIVCTIAWYFGSHIIYWLFTVMTYLFNGAPKHWLAAHPESQIIAGERWTGVLLAWFFAGIAAVRTLWSLTHRSEPGNPLATTNWILAYIAFPFVRFFLAIAILLAELLGFILAPVYVALLLLLTLFRIFGGRALLARYLAERNAAVIDLAPDSPWRELPRPNR